MSQINGKQIYELLQSGVAVLSDDQKTLVNVETKEVLAKRITSKDGIGYFKALADEDDNRGSVKVCIEWAWDEENKIKICLEWSFEEK